ncbi:MAG: UDP-N-acetylglucosamine 1-carboxyvinyltransferase, partial [Syntrophomonadaceae bacterium]
MDQFVIEGPVRLQGEVTVSGAKNAALPCLAAALLTPDALRLENLPDVADIRTLGKLLQHIGAEVVRDRRCAAIEARTIGSANAPYDLVKTMRASVLVLGPLVARHGEAIVSLPGGCAIGARPIDQHLKGLEAMGAKITLTHGSVIARAKRLRGAANVCDVPTVTGTENLMMAAALAKGRTTIENAAREPEV